MIEAPSPLVEKDRQMIESLGGSHGVPFLVINKIDLVKKETLLPIIDQYQRLHAFEKIIPISAITGEGVDILLDEILKYLPESPPYYPEDMITDQTERFLVSEIIREKVIQHSYQEIPYSTAVTIEEFKGASRKESGRHQGNDPCGEEFPEKDPHWKRGTKIEKIGETARKEIEALLKARVFLELWVNVEKNWTQDSRALNRLGYGKVG